MDSGTTSPPRFALAEHGEVLPRAVRGWLTCKRAPGWFKDAQVDRREEKRPTMIRWLKKVFPWLGNIVEAVYTVVHGMWVTLRTALKTYRPERKTFTEHFEYPELPVPVAARYRGFHRFDLTTCISCDQCAKACPVDCIYIGKEKVEGGKGFKITGYTIDYSKCMFCALCVEPCPVDCIFMGASHDLSCFSRDGTIVDFSRLPVDVAWSRSSLNPTAIAQSKVITEPVHGGPNQ